MTVTALPTPPSRLDPPDTFIANADAFVKALPTFGTELNALQADVQDKANKAATATDSANTALAAANAAQAIVGANSWVSGQTYAVNSAAISPSNRQTYRRVIAGAGTTDPATDLTNWALLFGNDANGAFLPVTITGTDIDLSKGNYFKVTVSGTVSLNIINCPSVGYSFILEVIHTSGSVSLPVAVTFASDVSPTLTSGKTHLFMLVTSSTGTKWRAVAAANFTT